MVGLPYFCVDQVMCKFQATSDLLKRS